MMCIFYLFYVCLLAYVIIGGRTWLFFSIIFFFTDLIKNEKWSSFFEIVYFWVYLEVKNIYVDSKNKEMKV